MYWQGLLVFDGSDGIVGQDLGQCPRGNFGINQVESMDGSQHRQLFTIFGMFQGLNMWLTNGYS